MKNKFIIKLTIIVMFFCVIFCLGNARKVLAANSTAYVTNYEVNSNVPTSGNDKITSTLLFTTPTNIYEFWDENNVYNIVCEIYGDSTQLLWIKLDSNMNKISEVYIPRYLTKFGNAIYHNGYLYVVYGANDNSTTNSSTSDFATTVTIEMVKYNTKGEVVATLPIMGKDTSRMTIYNTHSTFLSYGTRYAFKSGNCDLAVNSDNVIKCVFGKQMYNGHQMSYSIYVDADTLEHLNKASTMDFDNNKYYNVTDSYWASHSFDQRVIATEDGHFLSVDRADGEPRAFYVAKTTDGTTTSRLQLEHYEMFHFREGSDEAYGYNSTMSCLGNIVEVSDGYILVSGSEKTLSLNYAEKKFLNESQNIFIQKYSKDFSDKTEQTIQMLDTQERKSETSRTDTENKGSFLLPDEGVTDYGVKWLTNYQNDKSILEVRAIAIDNDQVAILWAEDDIAEPDSVAWSEYGYMLMKNVHYYYQIIDKNGNLVKGPYEIQNAKLTRLINYNYKDNCIYWTELSSNSTTIKVNKLDLTKTSQEATLTLDKTEATITDADITSIKLTATTNKDTGLIWTSTNTSVATVDSNGNVTILGNGTATIKVSLNEYALSKECKITVDYKCESIEVNSNYYEMKIGKTKDIKVNVLPSNAKVRNLEWKSSDENIVSINNVYSNGSISLLANGLGETDIIGTTIDGSDLSVTIKIKVIKPITSIKIDNWISSIERGKTYQLIADIAPTDATEEIMWSSSNPSILTVDQTGKITAKSNGTATIFCVGVSGSYKTYRQIRVETPLDSIGFESNTVEIEKGMSTTLTVKKYPFDTTDKQTVTWSSSDSSVAMVTQEGVITAIKPGTTNIKAVCGNCVTVCKVTVTSKLESISLNKTSIALYENATQNLSVTYNPTDTTDSKYIAWSSDNELVATVDTNGKVSAKSKGTANITATVGTKTATCRVTVEKREMPFIDVEPSDWFFYVVRDVYKSKTILGTTDTTFEPNGNLTRGMLVTILWRMENTPITNDLSKKFSDVPSNAWFYHAVNWAASKGIVSGINENEFKPNDNITREQLAVMLRNYSIYKKKYKQSNISLNGYTDNNKVSSWAESAVEWAVSNRIISGKENGTKIDPQGNAIRAEAAAMICNYRQNIK